MGVLYHFSEVFESCQAETIWDISIPAKDIRKQLKQSLGVDYKSNQWVFTQLRRYEDEIGAKLFEKTKADGADSFDLMLHRHMIQFVQKQHLHVPQKIKVANGVYDKINSVSETADKRLSVLLGAGSTAYHIANIFLEKHRQSPCRFTLYTHNAGILPMLFSQHIDHRKISIVTAGGKLEPTTQTILGNADSIFPKQNIDFIVQGTSLVHKGNLYIESSQERKIKSAILHTYQGKKILVLTKHEFRGDPAPETEPYGTIMDYDYVIVPRSVHREAQKSYELLFLTYAQYFEPEILNWNYSILKVKKANN